MAPRSALVCLADGTTFPGVAFGAAGAVAGEVVFTTGMTGYQEILTDPSYEGQLVTMTMPEIGNTGVNEDDHESVRGRPHAAGFIVRNRTDRPSNWRATESLDAFLEKNGVVAVSGVDTRSLTRHLRDHGSQNGAIGAGSRDELIELARHAPSMTGLDLVSRVTPKEPYLFTESSGVWRADAGGRVFTAGASAGRSTGSGELSVVAFDFGAKRNILRCLVDAGCRVTAVPATATASDVLALDPDGVFLSNGPGDPAAVDYAVQTIRALLGKRPIFGICLGHQLLARAIGAQTYKLKFGHRGINQPVLDQTTGRVEITSQNHGFAVDQATLPPGASTTHVHLNDGTSEGLVVEELDAFSVQYHPEAAAGPHDAHYLFARFVDRMERRRAA